MHGPIPPPPRGPGGVITMRVLITAAALLSCGILAWVPMLRIAIVRRRTVDWVALPVVLVLSIGCFALAGYTGNTDSWQANAGTAALLLLACGSAVYYLITELSRRKPTNPAAYAPYSVWPNPSHPYPPNQPPFGPATYHDARTPVPIPGVAPAQRRDRIGQVRADLAELSDYLRTKDKP